MTKIIILFTFLFYTSSAYNSFIDNSLFISERANPVSTRENALGLSYLGISDDGSSLYLNPAGLNLLKKNEIQINSTINANNSNIYYQRTDFNSYNSISYPNQLTISLPVKSEEGNFTFSFGYLVDNISNNVSYNKLNVLDSYIKNEYYSDFQFFDNFGIIKNEDNIRKIMIDDSLEESYSYNKEGQINRYFTGISFSMNEITSFGINFSYYHSYLDISHNYSEIDIYDKYSIQSENNVNFNKFTKVEKNYSEMEGYATNLSFLYTPNLNTRYFINLDIPIWNEVRTSIYEKKELIDDDENILTDKKQAVSNYTMNLPIKLNTGFSYNYENITIALGATIQNMNMMGFNNHRNASYILQETNEAKYIISTKMKDLKVDFGLGFEYKFQKIPLFLRTSFTKYGELYNEEYDKKYNRGSLGFGLAYIVFKNFLVDLSYSFEEISISNQIYNSQKIYTNYYNNKFFLGLSLRF